MFYIAGYLETWLKSGLHLDGNLTTNAPLRKTCIESSVTFTIEPEWTLM